MPQASTLVDLLRKCSSPVAVTDEHARLLATKTPDDRAAAICAEIGETVLARKLTFRVGDQAAFTVDAGGRRMMRLLEVYPDAIAQPGDMAFEQRDDVRLTQQTAVLGRVLAAVCAHDAPLTVTSSFPDGLYQYGAVGFPPDRLYDAVVANAKSRPIKTENLPAPVIIAKPVADPPAKFSPTDAIKAMIRDKVKAATTAAAVTAATNPGPAKVHPAAQDKKAPTMLDERLRAFFNEVQNDVTFCAVVQGDGNVDAVGGKTDDDRILAFASEVMTDLVHWRETTTKVLSMDQMIVMKAAGIQNQSLAYFSSEAGAVIVIFVNTDLSRIFMVANKFLVMKGSK